ncbi:MAG TPA: GAF domain-containing SpoIIE family protein phosphatase [Acidimicrobiales bacterium]|jgi:putative methionine-R-sulfoxide reductase with GAF domain|nr:GAF domain-containing SpoIIE family protein phosphatase [Acidimicrobiales bacterium]
MVGDVVPPDSETGAYLARLEALTDTALSGLDLETFLRELLERVRQILRADTAAVLLLDESNRTLVATAAQGIEEEVRQGVKVPVGIGFAGSIAAQRSPVVLERVDATTVANPILWEKGIKVMLGVPLLAGARLLGVLHVGRLDSRPFSAPDVQMLQIVAERIAAAIQTARLAAEQSAANLLERSLLPDSMPDCEGIEFATRYMTPEDRSVGGDWYDGFVTSAGKLWVVVGDVAGRGLSAAVIMGRIKSTLRAYALLDLPPGEVLALTSTKIAHFETEAMATAICAVSEPPYREFRVASAGHPPPVVTKVSTSPQFLELHVNSPLGIPQVGESISTPVVLGDGDALVLYTDGLVERRGEHLGLGLERLRAMAVAEPAEALCQRIVSGTFGSSSPPDDVAIVVIRRTG